MIISENPEPTLKQFHNLMKKTDAFLNKDAQKRENYYASRNDQKLEENVRDALQEVAKGTPFENSIKLISGAKFPDITLEIAKEKLYGVEVKSTIKNQWTSTGSSILESTRIENVERIFMTFGKLGKPIEFRSKPYEECLSDIAVTHYPRYKIDMNLKKGETIFDKMKISYDELRKLDEPVIPVSKYYKSKLKPGESLWWSPKDESVPFAVRLFSVLDREEKDEIRVLLTTFFPSILGNNPNKYDNPSLWLLVHRGIISTHIRDEFSAGGQVQLKNQNGIFVSMPAVFGRIERYSSFIIETLNNADNETLSENWHTKIETDRISQWIDLCAKNYANEDPQKYQIAKSVLNKIFGTYETTPELELKVASPN